MCDRTYLSATRGENLGLERSSGNAGVDPVIYSEAAARYHGHPGKTGRNKATFLPFIPSGASGFPSKNRCSRPDKQENRFSITRRRNPRKIPLDKLDGSLRFFLFMEARTSSYVPEMDPAGS